MASKKTVIRSCIAFFIVSSLPYAISKVRWNELKSFYVDCESLESGMTLNQAHSSMKKHLLLTGGWSNASMHGVNETKEEHNSRSIYVPSIRHQADWCVLYANNNKLTRIVIHPD